MTFRYINLYGNQFINLVACLLLHVPLENISLIWGYIGGKVDPNTMQRSKQANRLAPPVHMSKYGVKTYLDCQTGYKL
jgi:hypothetical protein